MATAALRNDDSYTDIDDKHLEVFCLIWLDTNANIKETRNTEQKLRSIINYLKKFEDIKQCQQYIEQSLQKDRLILIVSGRLGQDLVPSIHKLRQVISIYIYCMDKKSHEQWALKFSKVKAVVTDLNELVLRIKEDHKIQKKIEEPLSINIFTTKGKSTMEVNGQFVFSQVLIDCLLRLKSTETDKTELINYFKTQYQENSIELDNIHEFQKDYAPNKVLWWYTRETFFYKTLNAALRTQDVHMIYLFRTFISDIQRQLSHYQSKNILKVYRSQMITNSEILTLMQSTDQFISINSFFSTSTNYMKALSFLDFSNTSNGLERVLFEIDADPKMATTKSFADISEHSDFPNESEVLFMIGSIFHLKSVNHNDNQIWNIKMSLCNDGEHRLKEVLIYMKQQIGNGETNLRILGKILLDMGKFDLAEKYFFRLLKQLPSNDPLLGDLYEDLGKLASQTGDYDMSVQWHQKSLEFKNKKQSTDKSNTNETNNSPENKDDGSFFSKIIQIFSPSTPNPKEKINISYNEETFKPIKNKILQVLALNNKDNEKNRDKILNDLLENGWQSLIKYQENINPKIYNEQINNNNNSELIKSIKEYFELKWKTQYSLSNQWFYLFLEQYKNEKNPQWYEHVLTRTAQYGNKYMKNCPILSVVLQILFDGIDDKCLKEANIFNNLWLSITHDGLKSIEKYSDYIGPKIMDEQMNKNQSVLFQTLCEYYRQSLFQLLKQSNISNIQNLYDLVLNDVVQHGWINGIKLIESEIPPIKFNLLLKNIDLFLKQRQIPLRASLIDIPPSAKWNKDGQTIGGQNPTLYGPHGVYVDDEQTVYVADYDNHRIVAWQSNETDGQIVAGGHGKGNGAHQLNWPTDVVVDKERDSLIICDRGNKRVVRWPRQNGTSGETIISNISCYGLTIDDNGFLYVTDDSKHEVRRYQMGESQGIVVAGGNGEGNRLDQLHDPYYVFVDEEHSVFVSEFYNHRVIKWIEGAKEGIVVAGGQGQGKSLTQLNNPYGVLVDQLGTVYVADAANHRIVHWSKGAQQGDVIVGGNSQRAKANQLNWPIGLSFDRHGNLYVVDSNNSRLQRFNLETLFN